MNATTTPKLSGIAAKMLALYIEWHTIMTKHLPKDVRYSIGVRIDTLFAEVLEGITRGQFSLEAQKLHYIAETIVKNDTLKFMLYALHEIGGIDASKFISLSLKAEEIGRMLYGWKMNIQLRTAGRAPA